MKKIWITLMAVALVMTMSVGAFAEGETISLTTGQAIDHANKFITVQIDNEPGARPQKGLSAADVVYEIELYNGGYTRYTAVFNDRIPTLLEAVRSARISNVDLYMNFGGAFVYYGGQSYEGRDVFKYMNSNMKEDNGDVQINAMSYKDFKRDSARKAPNNVYCNLQDVQAIKGYAESTRSPLSFSDTPTAMGDDVSNFEIIYRDGSYHPSYRYNAEDGLYYRFYNGSEHMDGDTGEQITCSNVIVMRVETSWHNGMSDAPIHELTGSGECEYFIGGKHFKGTWSRPSIGESTVYSDQDGNVVQFAKGKTYIQIAKDRVEVNANS